MQAVFLLGFAVLTAGAFAEEGKAPLSPLSAPFSGAAGASLRNDFSFLSNPALLAFQTKPSLLAGWRLSDRSQTGLLAAQDFSGGLPVGLFLSKIWKSEKAGKAGKGVNWGFAAAQKAGRSLAFGGAVHKTGPSLYRARLGLGFKAGRRAAVGLSFGSPPVSFSRRRAWRKAEQAFSAAAFQGFGDSLSARAEADFDFKAKGWIVKGGAEGRLFKFLALRGGGICHLKRNSCSQSFGAGVAGARLQIDYGAEGLFRRRLLKRARSRRESGGASHTLSARLTL